MISLFFVLFFFKQKTAYDIVSRDWSSDVCSSDLAGEGKLTGDTGNATFSGSQYDLQIVAGRLYWTAQPSREVTEVRSVSLQGGPVRIQRVPGTYALTRWPWTVSVGGAGTDPVKLHNV